MICVPSKPITVISSNITTGADATIPEWSAGAYAKNDKVKMTTDSNGYVGYVYQSLIDNNTDIPNKSSKVNWRPIAILEYDSSRVYNNGDMVTLNGLHNAYLSMEDNNNTDPSASDSKWQFLFKTNEYAFSDYYFTTTTEVFNQNLELEISFSTSDTISFFGVYGSDMTIEELDSDGNIVDTTIIHRVNLLSIVDYPTYLQFKGCNQVDYHTQKLIPMDMHHLRITLNPVAHPASNADVAEIGTIAVGLSEVVGCTLYGLKINRVALTPASYDKWGDVVLSGDSYIKMYTATMKFRTENLDAMDVTLYKVFNSPAVYIFDEDAKYSSLITFGIMEVADINVEGSELSSVPLRVKSFKYKKNLKSC